MFVTGIDDNFNVLEELAGMQSMQGRTTGKDICGAIIDFVIKKLSTDLKIWLDCALTVLQICVEKQTERWLCYKSTLKERLSLTTALYTGKFYAARY